MKPLTAFRSRIAPMVQGASDLLIDQAVLDTCIDFCERSLVVKRMLDSFTTKSGKAQYDLDGGNQQVVTEVVRVWCDSNELHPINEDELRTPFNFVSSIPGQQNGVSTPRWFNETDPGVLAFYPTPDKAYTINLRVAMRPTRSATSVEDQLFEDWVEAIAHGSLARLFMYPGEFMNATAAQLHGGRYEEALNRATLEAVKGKTRAPMRVQPVHV